MARRSRSYPRGRRPWRGFTLVEMMVVVAVVVVLLAVGGPAMSHFTASNQLAGAKSTFTGALSLARSEAAKRGGAVILHALGTPVAGNEFAAGWEIVSDDNGDGVAGGSDTVLRRFDALPSGVALSGSASLGYRATGYLATAVDQVYTVCRTHDGHDGYQVTVTPSGVADVAAISTCP
jgi:type IV fimbrial biogenesis protein FimT